MPQRAATSNLRGPTVTGENLPLAELLIAARKKAGLSQSEVARRINEYQSWMARLESGRRPIKVDELVKLGAVVGFDPVILLRRAMRSTQRKQQ
jgi:transcriptional regulator with XRE-family HTH domain